MAALKNGDRVKVRPGKEHDPATKGAEGNVTTVEGTVVTVKFDGITEPDTRYVERDLEKQ